MVGFLASGGKVGTWAVSRVQALLWQASCLWGMALESCPPRHPHSCRQPLRAFITDLHSESSLLFLLRAREKKGQTDSWGSRRLPGSHEGQVRRTYRGGTTDVTQLTLPPQATHTW